jgi:magnesium-transporting ATPase (P-type)
MVEIDDLAGALHTDLERGLSASDATRILAEHGPNELRGTPTTPTWRKVLAQFQDPLIYLLLGAVLVSLVAWSAEGRAGLPVDAIVIGIVVLLNAVLGYAQEARPNTPSPRCRR